MKLNVKKIIAREFLILTFLTFFSVLCGLCIYPYNAFRRLQFTNNEKEISFLSQKKANLLSIFNHKRKAQENFYKALSAEYDLIESEQNTSEKTWEGLGKAYLSDSIPIRYSKWDSRVRLFLSSRGFNDAKTFEKFVGENIFNKNDSINYLKSKKVDQNVTELKNQSNQLKRKILSSREQIDFSLLIFKILFLIAFPLRFLILGIKWSINTLNQKE